MDAETVLCNTECFLVFFFFSFDFLIILPNPKQLKGTRPLDSRLLSGDFLISGSFLLPNARSQLLRQFYFWSYKPP